MNSAAVPGTPENEAAINAVYDAAGVEPGTEEAQEALDQAAIPGTPEAAASIAGAIEAANDPVNQPGAEEVME